MVLNDNQKIGVGLITLGLCFLIIGIILFLDAALMAIGEDMCIIIAKILCEMKFLVKIYDEMIIFYRKCYVSFRNCVFHWN